MKKVLVLMAMAFAFAFQAAAQDNDATYATELLKPGEEAPAFTINDINGKDVSLSDFSGSYVVLDFWASWCPDCRKDVPDLARLYKTYGKNVKFVSISFDDKEDDWKNFVKSNGMEWTQLSELKKRKDSAVSSLYNIKWIPSMYIISPDGKVVMSTVMISKIESKLKEISGE